MDYQVVHAIAGRCRIRIPRIASDLEYASKLSWLIESLSFVTNVRVNAVASSVIVEYQVNLVSNALAQERLFTCIQQASISDVPEETIETDPLDRPQVNHWQDLGLPSISIGLALLAAPLELPVAIVTGAIALAAMPWFTRATNSLVQNRHFNIDFLDSLWMAIHTLNGQFVAPALKTTLVETRRSLRGMNAEANKCQALDLLVSKQYTLVERDGLTRQLAVKELRPGDRAIVNNGEVIPVDGRILYGTALIDTSSLTGDSIPVRVSTGDAVYASCLVLEGSICVLTQRTGNSTRAGLIAHLMQETPVYDTQIGIYQEELVKNAVVPTVCLGATIFAMTGVYSAAIAPFQLDFGSGIQISMPNTILAALTHAAGNGVYIRSGRVLETLAQVDTVIIDSTGTCFVDSIPPEISSAIATLLAQGINTYVLADDYQQVATTVFDRLGINFSDSCGSASQEIKVDVVRALQARGKTVAFVGDSIKDATVLAVADVSVAFARGNDLMQETADVLLLDNDLQSLTQAINTAKQAMEIVYQNTAIIVIPNIIVVIGGVFFGLNPVVNVITNNCSAAIAEFINSSRPPFGTNTLAQRTITAISSSTSSTVAAISAAINPPAKQESPSLV